MNNLLILALFVLPTTTIASNYTQSEVDCMSLAVYGEARGESKMGQLMVMDVINNRKVSSRYPNHICDVIKQHRQFSFWSGRYSSPKDKVTYKKIQSLVDEYTSGIWGGGLNGISKGSMWYHASNIRPRWSYKLSKVWHIDNHIFYK